MKKNLTLSLLLSLLLAACSAAPPVTSPASMRTASAAGTAPAAAPATPVATMSPERLAQELPFDQTLIKKKLDNGLTYYIRRNPRPEKRAEIWLAVNTGSILEEEDQRGLAHFIEHMAFNGTRRFAKQELVNYLESVGMEFGADVNAQTSFDNTVYTLRVPTDRPDVLEKAFEILEDWAGSVTFDPDEVNKERGVVIEEWRLGLGADSRIEDKQLPVLFQGSRYAERIPIGKKEILEKATPDQLRRFYHDWYRPDLMAVVVVGDIDPAQMEGLVKEHFSGLKNPPSERPREDYPVPTSGTTRVAVTTDPEATDTTLAIYSIIDKRPEGQIKDYRRSLIEQLYHDMLNSRFRELNQGGSPPFSWAGSSSGRFVRTRDVIYQMVGVPEGGLQEGFEALLTEVERVRRHGFTPTELDRAKSELSLFYDQAAQENGKLDSGNFAAEYLRNFFDEEPVPGIAYEVALVREILPTIQLDEVNHLAEQWTGGDRVILLSAPEKKEATLPGEKELLATFQTVTAHQIDPWVDRVRQGPLVADAPRPGKIVSETQVADLGVTEWRLSNGVRVILKPTDFRNDEIMLTAFSPGGSSLVPDNKYLSAAFATALIRDAGFGRFDRITLEKALAGKAAGVLPYIGTFQEGVRGLAASRDLETMFQLVYLNITSPRKDPKLFLSLVAGLEEQLRSRAADPDQVFQDEMLKAMAQGDLRKEPLSLARLGEIDFNTAYDIYRDRFADAGDFTFVLVGNFTPESVKPMVLTWLGSLPSKGRKESWSSEGGDKPLSGVVKV
jgi:zinc protease